MVDLTFGSLKQVDNVLWCHLSVCQIERMLKGDTFSFALDLEIFCEKAEARAGNFKRKVDEVDENLSEHGNCE